MRILVCLIFLNILFLSTAQELRIFAASSLTAAFNDLAAQFEKDHPETTLNLHFAGSSLLVTQLEQGASADILATADTSTLSRVISLPEARVFATNQMVVVSNQGTIRGLKDLAEQDYFLVLAHKNVPAGAYAREVLVNLNKQFGDSYSQNVLSHLVSEESNVKQAYAKVTLGEADVTVVYRSDFRDSNGLHLINIPEAANIKALYPIAVLPESRLPELAQSFVAFVLSEQGQAILERHEFSAP